MAAGVRRAEPGCRSAPYRAGVDVATGPANDGIAHPFATGTAGPPASPRRAGMPRDHAGALGMRRAVLPSPHGRRRAGAGDFRQQQRRQRRCWQPAIFSVTRALSPLQLLTPLSPAPARRRFPSAGPPPTAFQHAALQPSSTRLPRHPRSNPDGTGVTPTPKRLSPAFTSAPDQMRPLHGCLQ